MITSKKVLDFVVKSIICRFGLPKKIVSDNGTQFDSDLFTEFCERYGIVKSFSSVAYPQANGQVEAVNKTLKASLKKRLDEAKGVWPEQLPQVLWAYRTSHRTPTGHTPFSLTFGSEAVLPVEIKVLSHRVQSYDQDRNHELLCNSLDLVDERREDSQLQLAHYQQKITRYFNIKVKKRAFSVGDLVLRRVFLAGKDPKDGVLGPNWEGPYQVIEVIKEGTYKLARLDGGAVPRTWNAIHLKRYYQ